VRFYDPTTVARSGCKALCRGCIGRLRPPTWTMGLIPSLRTANTPGFTRNTVFAWGLCAPHRSQLRHGHVARYLALRTPRVRHARLDSPRPIPDACQDVFRYIGRVSRLNRLVLLAHCIEASTRVSRSMSGTARSRPVWPVVPTIQFAHRTMGITPVPPICPAVSAVFG